MTTYRNTLKLADLLDPVAGRKRLEALERRRQLLLGQGALLRVRDILSVLLVRATEDNLVLLIVVLVEQGLLVVYRTRRNLHLKRVLLSVLLDLLEMLIVAVLSQPGDDITRGPVDLERVGVLIVHVVLSYTL